VAKCGELGQMHAPSICRKMFEGDTEVRLAAIEALTGMGERGQCFQEEIESLLWDPEVGHAAEAALTTMATAALEGPVAEEEEDAEPVDLGYAVAAPGPSLPVGLLFPGQGSQYVKMLANVKDLPKVKSMLRRAKAILGYDLLQVCLSGPEEKLEQTRICQPAMFVGGLAAMELLRLDKPDAAARRQAVAGLSLGEYTALTVAGVLDFETGLRLVKLRGEAMQEAALLSPQAMISVAGLERGVVQELCEEAKADSSDVCGVANFLFPNGFSCSGTKEAIARLHEKVSKNPQCLQAKILKTQGAFHSDLMLPAKKRLMAALREAQPKMRPPVCDVYMNLTGAKISPGADPAEICDLLAAQLTGCVEWSACMAAMIGDGVSEFYECGPMKQLKAMMKRIDPKAWEKTTSVFV